MVREEFAQVLGSTRIECAGYPEGIHGSAKWALPIQVWFRFGVNPARKSLMPLAST